MPNLSGDFLLMLTTHWRERWQIERYQISRSEIWAIVWNQLDVVGQLACLKDGAEAAWEVWNLSYHNILGRVWEDSGVVLRHWLLVLFDEKLHTVCQACGTSSTVACWREYMTKVPVVLDKHARYGLPHRSIQLLPRSMRYMLETHAEETLHMVVSRITGHALPTELVCMIYDHLRIARGLVRGPKKKQTWHPLALLSEQCPTGTTFESCCGLSTKDTSVTKRVASRHDDVLHWSNRQHRYIRYHPEYAHRRFKKARYIGGKCEWGDIGQGSLIYRRCRGRKWRGPQQGVKFTRGPFPLTTGYFEYDGRREWRSARDTRAEASKVVPISMEDSDENDELTL